MIRFHLFSRITRKEIKKHGSVSLKKRNERKTLGESGQTLTEYLSLLILISLVALGTVGKLGRTIKRQIKSADEKIGSIHFTSSRGGSEVDGD
jgi:Flp pilus assembly pilin Flp